MRVYVQRPDGAIVDLRVAGPYNTDALDDMTRRALVLLAAASDLQPADEPVQR